MEASLLKELWWFSNMMIVLLRGASSQSFLVESPDNDYCTRRMTVKTCPTPPTIDSLDLRGLLGSYYEVGTTARHKLRNEGGLICAQSNFSVDILPPFQDETSVVAINVQNTGLQVVGVESVSALAKISYSASDVCANAARMCAVMDTSSKLSEALLRISSVVKNITSSFPSHASTLSQASATINSSVASVKMRLDGLARSVTVISRIAAELSQGVGPLDPLLRALRTTVTLGSSEVHDLGSVAIGNLTLSRNLVTQVMSHMTNATYIELLFEASTLIEQEVEVLGSQVSRIQGLLSSIGGPWVDMIEADGISTNKSPNLVVSKGQAIQNPDQRGDMMLKIKQTTQPYQIIALEGLPFLGYSSLLVYSCKLDSNGDPVGDLFLLSRSPTILAPTVSFFLNMASRYGISTDCDSVFVPTVQNDGECGVHSE
ncbi:hypothetical protein L7F22_058022 [Adiantum nelumboides]|nr:hypothetical protein [Adiantum nelumboides]